MSIATKIIEMLKKGFSQKKISDELDIPRSRVQKVSDEELGVSPESLKSLTTENIVAIQKASASGSTNSSLASEYNVSPKIIARALLVKLTEEANNVTVISPVETLGEDGQYDTDMPLAEGGFALIKNATNGLTCYVGPWLEGHKSFLCICKNDAGLLCASLQQPSNLSPEDGEGGGLDTETLGAISELTELLTQQEAEVTCGFKVVVKGEGEYAVRGQINSKRQIGYHDPLVNKTVRVSINQVLFNYTPPVDGKDEDVEEEPEIECTKKRLSGKDLDLFLSKHQIMVLPDQVVIAKDGRPLTITTSHGSYQAIVDAISEGDIDRAYLLMEPRKAIEHYSCGYVTIEKNRIKWDGNDITSTSVAKRALSLASKGDEKNMLRLAMFMNKLYQNPSASLVQSGKIFEFMSYSDIEIDDEGDIILYKSVRGNYLDKHSGTISNKPGTIVRMTRSFVNDDNKSLCSYGLHVCSLAYLRKCFGSTGQRVVRCKLNPKDIVSVTNDYGSSKIRCCEYLVMDDYTAEYNRQYKSIDMVGVYK